MRPRRLPFAGLLLAVLLGPLAGSRASAEPAKKLPDPSDTSLTATERLRALIDRVKHEQKGLETLEAQFVQRQESSMLVTPEVSRGEFSYAAPDRVRWEYVSPKPISVVIDGTEMTTWYRDLGKAEQIRIGRYSNQVFKYLGASGSLETLIDYFRVSVTFPKEAGKPYKLYLAPRYERIAKRLESMTLEIDPDRYLPVRLMYVAADGDLTEYTFRNFKVNAGIPADRFELHLTDGVQLKRLDLDRSGR